MFGTYTIELLLSVLVEPLQLLSLLSWQGFLSLTFLLNFLFTWYNTIKLYKAINSNRLYFMTINQDLSMQFMYK